MQAEPLLEWSEAIQEFVSFVALFLGAGAVGFRYFALRGARIETDRPFYDDAAQRAAGLGFVGLALSLILAVIGLPGLAARRHVDCGSGRFFVLVLAGLSALLHHEPTRERRGIIAADMVNGFSPLALTMGGVVVLFGLITAWRHLHRIENLWSTPYGIALIVKLLFVAAVFALGAWNWRRQRPTLGTEEAAVSIRRSGVLELIVATVVLVVTAIIVSLPSPKA